MKKLICLLFVLAAFNVQAKEVTVTAYGEGQDYDWAVMNAVENAVRQTSTVTVERQGMHKVDVTASITDNVTMQAQSEASDKIVLDARSRDGLISHEGGLDAEETVSGSVRAEATQTTTAAIKDNSKDILAQYKGSVESYEVLEHSVENGLHKVKIKATVIKEDVYDAHDYKSKDLVKKADYSLAVMPFKMSAAASCLGKKLNLKEVNSLIGNLFVEKLAPSRKFNLLDRNNMDDYAAEMEIIQNDMTLPENKVKLKNLAAADYILVGTIDNFSATTSKSVVQLTGEVNYSSSSKLKLSYRILEAATMEIVSVGSVEKKFAKAGAFSSCANVQELLFKRAVGEAAEKILTDIFPDYQPAKKAEAPKATRKKAPARAAEPAPDYSLPLY